MSNPVCRVVVGGNGNGDTPERSSSKDTLHRFLAGFNRCIDTHSSIDRLIYQPIWITLCIEDKAGRREGAAKRGASKRSINPSLTERPPDRLATRASGYPVD